MAPTPACSPISKSRIRLFEKGEANVGRYRMKRTVSLIAISLLTGILWRVELEARWGWATLDWIASFHWAIPFGGTVYLFWMHSQLRDLPRRKRQVVLAVAVFCAILAYFAGGTAMAWAWNRWIGLLPRWQSLIYRASPFIAFAIIGVIYFMTVARLAAPSPISIVFGAVCYALAFPTAILLLWLTDHKGGPDTIHAIKSGFVFPIISFGLGLPVTMRPRTANNPSHHTTESRAAARLPAAGER
jgi:hypothetical protein